MAIKKYGPTTPGRRGMTVTDYSVLSKVAPEVIDFLIYLFDFR